VGLADLAFGWRHCKRVRITENAQQRRERSSRATGIGGKMNARRGTGVDTD
jgi:hypothetical protein